MTTKRKAAVKPLKVWADTMSFALTWLEVATVPKFNRTPHMLVPLPLWNQLRRELAYAKKCDPWRDHGKTTIKKGKTK